MDLLDSKNVTNRIRKRTVALAVFVHLYLTVFTLGIWLILLTVFGPCRVGAAQTFLSLQGRCEAFGKGPPPSLRSERRDGSPPVRRRSALPASASMRA